MYPKLVFYVIGILDIIILNIHQILVLLWKVKIKKGD